MTEEGEAFAYLRVCKAFENNVTPADDVVLILEIESYARWS